MKTKYFFLAALAGMTLAGCSSDDILIADTPPADDNNGMTPIMFNSFGHGMTRADFVGAEAADLLNNKFIVTGFKGNKANTANSTANPGSIVFDNYLVEYAANTAYTTASNTNNWEYVGKNPIDHAKANGITSQTIKYWDYSQPQYDFLAWAVGKIDATTPITPIYDEDDALSGHQVRVSAIAPNGVETSGLWRDDIVEGTGADAKTYKRPAYTFEGTAEDLSHCYISDIVTVKKSGAGTYGEVEGYGQPVTLKFRQLGTKVRIGLYETIPGYSVKNVEFYSAATGKLVTTEDTNPETSTYYTADEAAEANASAKIFTTTANQIFDRGTYTVYFPTVDSPDNADNNQAHIKFSPKVAGSNAEVAQKTTVDWGGLKYTGRQEAEKGDAGNFNIYLGRTSNTASFAGESANNYYVFYLPNETGTNLNLRVNYTLESIDGSGEDILVQGATAQVPSIYTTWKPGYAYTYLFKISDKTNGHTGLYDPEDPNNTYVNSDPAGLYPITFDAIVVNAEEGNNTQETITLVSTPSITTYQNGSKVVNNNEYTYLEPSGKITGEIYVTVNDGEESYAPYTPESGAPLAGLYTESGGVFTLVTSGTYNGTGTYYSKNTPSLDASNLATLTDKVALYIVEDGTTEAQVIDALQYQEDDGTAEATANTPAVITGRNTVVLTGSNLELTNSVTYGVDGNTITVGNDQAAKFTPADETKTFAFVYIKQAAVADNNDVKYSPIAFDDATVATKYRFKTEAATKDNDVQKGVVYFAPDASNDNKLTKKSVFIGQDVSKLYLRSGQNEPYSYTLATGYAKTTTPATEYYYYVGTTPTKARNIAYADFNATGDNQLYVKSGAYYVAKTESEPVDGTAYYYRTGAGTEESPYVHTYCVILPEQIGEGWVTLDESGKIEVESSEKEIIGMTYFDMYTVNDGVYYAKIIKIAAAQ